MGVCEGDSAFVGNQRGGDGGDGVDKCWGCWWVCRAALRLCAWGVCGVGHGGGGGMSHREKGRVRVCVCAWGGGKLDGACIRV